LFFCEILNLIFIFIKNKNLKQLAKKVILFIPCFIDQFYPEVGFATVKILKKLGFDIIYDKRQTCCGQPAFNSGYWKETITAANRMIKIFNVNDYPIVSPSASCLGFMKRNYPKLSKDKNFQEQVKLLTSRMFELTDFLVNKLNITDLGSEFNATVTYHDACSALREYGIKKEPRILLENVKGLKLIEMKEAETCCGFGGTFMLKMKEISLSMVKNKVQSALETGAQYIVSTEASCFLNIGSYIKANKLPIKTIHIAQILASF